MFKTSRKLALLFVLLTMSFAVPVLAISVEGGEWNYGGHHDPSNWGAYSSYYHARERHYARVSSTQRPGKSSKVYAGPGGVAYAFINTDIGEHVDFGYGF